MIDQSYQDFIESNHRWNFVVNVLDLTFYNLALSFIFGSTVLSLYTSYLTSSAILIGLIPAVQSVGFYLPQLLLARKSSMMPRKKPFLVRISVFERMPYIFVALIALLWPQAPNYIVYTVLAVSLASATLAGGLGGPAWQSMLAKVIKPNRRGLLFGLSNALGGFLGILGAMYSAHVLNTELYPRSFGICFLLCFIFQLVSWVCLNLVREPALEPIHIPPPAREYWRQLPQVFHKNPNFARYLVGRSLIVLGTMATTFYIIYARKIFAVDDAFAADLTMAALVSQTIATPLLGALSDKLGHKWLTEVSAFIGALAVLAALFAPSGPWFYLVFILMNASTSGAMVANLSMTMDFCDVDEMPTFIALANTVIALPVLLTPVIGGWLVDLIGYTAMFAIAFVITLLGMATMHWFVKEPRNNTKAQAEPVASE